MGCRGIIFDKDGTLFDYFTVWGPVIADYTDTILRELGRSDSLELREEFLKMVGVGKESMHAGGLVFRNSKLFMLARLFVFCKVHRLPFAVLVQQIKTGFTDAHRYMEQSLADNAPQEPVERLFRRLAAAGYHIGIVTNDTALSTEICLKHLAVGEYVDFTSTYDDHLPKKPHPEAFRQFCRKFSLEPSEVVMVGDSVSDMKFARNGGAGYTVAVLTGSNDFRRLSRYADVVYPDLTALNHDQVIFPPKNEERTVSASPLRENAQPPTRG